MLLAHTAHLATSSLNSLFKTEEKKKKKISIQYYNVI